MNKHSFVCFGPLSSLDLPVAIFSICRLFFFFGCATGAQARPRHYLSQESAAFFRARNAGKPPHFIVGRVIVIDSLVAGPRGSNPFDLAEGAAYHVITVESI
jgi:hypothetical protein